MDKLTSIGKQSGESVESVLFRYSFDLVYPTSVGLLCEN